MKILKNNLPFGKDCYTTPFFNAKFVIFVTLNKPDKFLCNCHYKNNLKFDLSVRRKYYKVFPHFHQTFSFLFSVLFESENRKHSNQTPLYPAFVS